MGRTRFPAMVEGYSIHRDRLEHSQGQMDPRITERFLGGAQLSGADFYEILEFRKGFMCNEKQNGINKNRAPTISFTINNISSKNVSKKLVENGIAIRNDNFYAWRCLHALGIDTNDEL